jgi:hypothetical protein
MRTNMITEAAVKPSGWIRTRFATSPTATMPIAFQSVGVSFSSSGCQPPRSAATISSRERIVMPTMVM